MIVLVHNKLTYMCDVILQELEKQPVSHLIQHKPDIPQTSHFHSNLQTVTDISELIDQILKGEQNILEAERMLPSILRAIKSNGDSQ